MICNGYEGARRLYEIQDELLERNEVLDPRAEVELIKTLALCRIEGHMHQMLNLQQRQGEGRPW